MTEPTTPQLVTVEVDRYSSDEQPALFENVDDVNITEFGLLTIDHNVTEQGYDRTFYAPGQWAAAEVRGIRKPQPNHERRGPKPGRRPTLA